MKKHAFLLLGMLAFFTAGRLAAQESALPPVTRTYAVKNVHITVRPGEVIDMGTIVVKDGLIDAVGKTVAIPYDAKVLEADSMYVYAGFIDGLSHVALKTAEQQEAPSAGNRRQQPQRSANPPGNPTNEQAGIQPERRASDLLDPKARSIGEMRQLGFTAAHVVPEGGMLPGYGALVLLAGDSPDAMILRDETALFAQLQGARGVYPATVIGVMSKWRELYKQAEQARAHEALYAKDPAGVERPAYDRSLHAFYPVMEKKMPVFFAVEDVKSAYRVLALQQDLGFPVALAGLKEGWHLTDRIKTAKIPVFLALELPDKPRDDKGETDREEKKKGEDRPAGAAAEKKEAAAKATTEEMSPEMKALEQRRAEEMKQLESEAATFAQNGIRFGFASLDVKSKDVRANLRRMIDNGLSQEAALAALTTVPADMLGLAAMMGTVEKGKIANLVVTDQPYFDEKANVRFVLVDGQVFEYAAQPKRKAADPNAVVKVAGRWSYSIDAMGTTMSGTLDLSDNGGAISGTISNPQTGAPSDIKSPSLEGNSLSFTTNFDGDGQTITVNWTLTIDGESFDGTVTAGQMGSFPIEGKRTGDPNQG